MIDLKDLREVSNHGWPIGDDAADEIERLRKINTDLLAALQEFEIVDCPTCEGSGKDRDDDRNACHRCGGAGEVIRGGWPAHIHAAIAKAEGKS